MCVAALASDLAQHGKSKSDLTLKGVRERCCERSSVQLTTTRSVHMHTRPPHSKSPRSSTHACEVQSRSVHVLKTAVPPVDAALDVAMKRQLHRQITTSHSPNRDELVRQAKDLLHKMISPRIRTRPNALSTVFLTPCAISLTDCTGTFEGAVGAPEDPGGMVNRSDMARKLALLREKVLEQLAALGL